MIRELVAMGTDYSLICSEYLSAFIAQIIVSAIHSVPHEDTCSIVARLTERHTAELTFAFCVSFNGSFTSDARCVHSYLLRRLLLGFPRLAV
jgi:hypothetical protein